MILPEEAVEMARLYEEHGTYHAVVEVTGKPLSYVYRRVQRAAELGIMGTEPVLPGYEIKRTTAAYDEDGNLLRQWVTQHKETGDNFEMPTGQVLKGVSALLDADGRIRSQWVKTKTDTTVPDLVAALKDVFGSYDGRAELIAPPASTDADLLSVYPIADQHIGMLAWGRETGDDYDLKIAADRLRDCTARLVSQSPASRQALILNLGDWQHTDDQRNVTPRSGASLDVDSRYYKILTTGVRLMMDVIELALAKHETVMVRNLPGNHDPHVAIALTVALGAFYSGDPRVNIINDPSEFFFHRFGTTLIGANHGHRMKPDRMAMTMAVSRREDWGATKYHWFLYGHIHHETAKEVGDVRCESFQTIASKDAYHANHGYTAGQSLTSITLDREDGEIGRHRVNISPPQSVTA